MTNQAIIQSTQSNPVPNQEATFSYADHWVHTFLRQLQQQSGQEPAEAQTVLSKILWVYGNQEEPAHQNRYQNVLETLESGKDARSLLRAWASDLGIKADSPVGASIQASAASLARGTPLPTKYFENLARLPLFAFGPQGAALAHQASRFAGGPAAQEIKSVNEVLQEIAAGLKRIPASNLTHDVATRLERLQREIKDSAILANAYHVADLYDAALILKARFYDLQRTLFQNRVAASTQSPTSTSLFKYLQAAQANPKAISHHRRKLAAPKPAGPVRLRKPAEAMPLGIHYKVGDKIAALANVTIEPYGIGLREHQWTSLGAFLSDWHVQQSSKKSREGLILKPTGSGKTHEMFGAAVIGMHEGMIDFARGDKVIVFVDQKDIRDQNARKLTELVNKYRESAGLGLDFKVTQIGGREFPVEDPKNYEGQILVVMTETVGRNGGSKQFEQNLQKALGQGRVALMILDEYDRSLQSETWKKSREVAAKFSGDKKLYELGFTATLPNAQRPITNILSEMSTVAAMAEGIIPPVTLVEVRTGTNLDKIGVNKTQSGESDFAAGELDTTVRNVARDIVVWMGHEAHAIRLKNKPGPTLVRGVSVAHAQELIRSYQIYQATHVGHAMDGLPVGKREHLVRPDHFENDDEGKVSSWGQRHILILEDPSETQLKAALAAVRNKETVAIPRYVYKGDELVGKDDRRYVAQGGTSRAVPEGLAVLITGESSDALRRQIFEGVQAGLIEYVGIVGIWKRGKDLGIMSNVVDAGATLSETDKTQLIRNARYRAGEIAEDGTVLQVHERRLVDYLDTWSSQAGSRAGKPLQSFAGVSGLSYRPKPGTPLDMRSGKEGPKGFGRLRYRTDERGRVIKNNDEDFLEIPEATIPVFGKEVHFLIPPHQLVGENALVAKTLRGIFNGALYKGKITEMSHDLAVSESELAALLNGFMPLNERLARRTATLIYQEREAIQNMRDQKVLTLGGIFPDIHPLLMPEGRRDFFENPRILLKTTGSGSSINYIYDAEAGLERKAQAFPKLLAKLIYKTFGTDLEDLSAQSGVALKQIFLGLYGKLLSEEMVRSLSEVIAAHINDDELTPETLRARGENWQNAAHLFDSLWLARSLDRKRISEAIQNKSYGDIFTPDPNAEAMDDLAAYNPGFVTNWQLELWREHGQGYWEGMADHVAAARQARDEEQHASEPEDGLAASPEDIVISNDLGRQTRRTLATMKPKEEKLLRMRFGIGETQEHTLEEVGKHFDLEKDRIRQIEAKALRILRHPLRAKSLLPFVGDGGRFQKKADTEACEGVLFFEVTYAKVRYSVSYFMQVLRAFKKAASDIYDYDFRCKQNLEIKAKAEYSSWANYLFEYYHKAYTDRSELNSFIAAFAFIGRKLGEALDWDSYQIVQHFMYSKNVGWDLYSKNVGWDLFKGEEGHFLFADLFTEGRLSQAHKLAAWFFGSKINVKNQLGWGELPISTFEARELREIVRERALSLSDDLGAVINEMAPRLLHAHLVVLKTLRFMVAQEEAERNSPDAKAELSAIVQDIMRRGGSADEDELLLWASKSEMATIDQPASTSSPAIHGPANKTIIEGGRGEIIDAADILVSDDFAASTEQEIVSEASDVGSDLSEPVTLAQAALSATLPTAPLTGLPGPLVR